jgi:hypothetical protein
MPSVPDAKVPKAKRLPNGMLHGLRDRLYELEAISSNPAAIQGSILAGEACMKRRSLLGGGEKILAKVHAVNMFKTADYMYSSDSPPVSPVKGR